VLPALFLLYDNVGRGPEKVYKVGVGLGLGCAWGWHLVSRLPEVLWHL